MDADGTAPPKPQVVNLGPEALKQINAFLRDNPDQLLQIPEIRTMIAASRIEQLKPEDIRTVNDETPSSIQNVVNYNIEGLKSMWALQRPAALINPLRSCEYIMARIGALDVLTVGPRTEAEIFVLLAAGFNPSRIRGLDLISYSPFVDVGDMHDMPYRDNSLDVVILGWVLAYSTDNAKAVSEVLRVARPGAFIAVGCEYNPLTNEEVKEELKGKIESEVGTDGTRFDTTEDILVLFEGHIDRVVFRHDVHPTMRAHPGGIMAIFQLKA